MSGTSSSVRGHAVTLLAGIALTAALWLFVVGRLFPAEHSASPDSTTPKAIRRAAAGSEIPDVACPRAGPCFYAPSLSSPPAKTLSSGRPRRA